MLTASALMATLFLGGWDIPIWQGDNMQVVGAGIVQGAAPAWWKTILTFGSFVTKTIFFVFVFMWVRWTVPRFRYDQVMHLGWKVMVPAALAFITITGGAILVLERLGIPYGLLYGLILTGVNALVMLIFFVLLDRDRVMSGAYAPNRERFLRERRYGDAEHGVHGDMTTLPRRRP